VAWRRGIEEESKGDAGMGDRSNRCLSTISKEEINMATVEPDGFFQDCAESANGPQVGDRAPDFFVQAPTGTLCISELAAQAGKVVLISQDSYQFHPG
jgi:hypothetical protein